MNNNENKTNKFDAIKFQGVKIKELCVIAEIDLEHHQLNNETSVGNSSIGRQFVDKDGMIKDGVSGDMLRHFHHENVAALIESPIKELCTSCMKNNTDRYGSIFIDGKIKQLESKDEALKHCVLCGEGFMAAKRNAKHTGITEYSHVVAMKSKNTSMLKTNFNVSPMPRNEVMRSGSYSSTTLFKASKIGYSDETFQYVIDDETLNKRFKYFVLGIAKTLSTIRGAKYRSNMPHYTGMRGYICISKEHGTMPIYSPEQEGYGEMIENSCNRSEDRLICLKFDNADEFNHYMELIAKNCKVNKDFILEKDSEEYKQLVKELQGQQGVADIKKLEDKLKKIKREADKLERNGKIEEANTKRAEIPAIEKEIEEIKSK